MNGILYIRGLNPRMYATFCLLQSTFSTPLNGYILSLVPITTQSLLVEHCSLVSFDGQTALVSVSSFDVFREIQRKKKDIKHAFINSNIIGLNESQKEIKINLRVVSCA